MEEAHEEGTGGRWDRRRTIWAVITGVIVAGVLTLLIIGLANQHVSTSIQSALAKGERPDAPAATVPVLLAADGLGPPGAPVSVSSLRGKIVVLNFWASWCEPCRLEAPILDAVAARYRRLDHGVVVVGLDVQDLRERATAFARKYGISYPVLRDGAGDDVKNAYQVPLLPETFVIDPDGRIALKVAGQLTDPAQLTTAIDQLRKERA